MDIPLLDYFQDPETPVGVMDLVYSLYVLYALLRGLFRGFAKEMSSVLGTLLTLWGAWTFYPALSSRLLNNNLLDNEMASQALAYVLLVFLFLLLWRLAISLLSKILGLAIPPLLQRPGGAVLGGFKAVVTLVILLIAAQLTRIEILQEKMIDESLFGRRVRDNVQLQIDAIQGGADDEPGHP